MLEIDIALVRQHLKADDEDVETELIEQYISSAVTICESYCNRKFYQDADALAADRTVALAALEAAKQQRDSDLDTTEDCDVQNVIQNRWFMERGSCLARLNGIVVDDLILSAILTTIGRLYRVRQDVATGQNAAGVLVPEGARRTLEPYVWVGDLGGAA